MQDDAILAGLGQVFEALSPEVLQQLSQVQSAIYALGDEELADVSDVLDAATDDPETRAELEKELGTKLPDDALTMLNAVVKSAMPQTEGYMPRQGMYDGGLASLGRGGDTMLAHISPGEAHLLRSRGGSGTINPNTGQPEFFLKAVGRLIKRAVDVVKPLLPAVLSVALPGVGAIAGAIGTAGAAALGAGLGTMLAGGNPRQALTAAAGTFAGASVMGGVSSKMGGGTFTEGVKRTISPQAAQAATQTAAAKAALSRAPDAKPSWIQRLRLGDQAGMSSEDAVKLLKNQNVPAADIAKMMRDPAQRREFIQTLDVDEQINFDVMGRYQPLGAADTGGATDVRNWLQKTKDFFDPRTDWRGGEQMRFSEALAQARAQDPGASDYVLRATARDIMRDVNAPLWQRIAPLAALGVGTAALTGGFEEKPADTSAMDEYKKNEAARLAFRQENPHLYGLPSHLRADFALPSMPPLFSARQGGSPSAAYIAPSARKQMSRGGDMGMGGGHFSGMGDYGSSSSSIGGSIGGGGSHSGSFSDMGGGGDWGGHGSVEGLMSSLGYGVSGSSSDHITSQAALQRQAELAQAQAQAEAVAAAAREAEARAAREAAAAREAELFNSALSALSSEKAKAQELASYFDQQAQRNMEAREGATRSMGRNVTAPVENAIVAPEARHLAAREAIDAYNIQRAPTALHSLLDEVEEEPEKQSWVSRQLENIKANPGRAALGAAATLAGVGIPYAIGSRVYDSVQAAKNDPLNRDVFGEYDPLGYTLRDIGGAFKDLPSAVGSVFTKEGWQNATPTFDFSDPNWYTDYFGAGDPSNLGGGKTSYLPPSVVDAIAEEFELEPSEPSAPRVEGPLPLLPPLFATSDYEYSQLPPSVRRRFQQGGAPALSAAEREKIEKQIAHNRSKIAEFSRDTQNANRNDPLVQQYLAQNVHTIPLNDFQAFRSSLPSEEHRTAAFHARRLLMLDNRIQQLIANEARLGVSTAHLTANERLQIEQQIGQHKAKIAEFEGHTKNIDPNDPLIQQFRAQNVHELSQKEFNDLYGSGLRRGSLGLSSAERRAANNARNLGFLEGRQQQLAAAEARLAPPAPPPVTPPPVAPPAPPPVTPPVAPPATLPPSVVERELPPAPMPFPTLPAPASPRAPSLLEQPSPETGVPAQSYPGTATARVFTGWEPGQSGALGAPRHEHIGVADPLASFRQGGMQTADYFADLNRFRSSFLPGLLENPQRFGMQMGGQTPDGLDLPYNNHQLPQTQYGPRITGPVLGPQRPTDDNIAAALHPNEFVFTTEAVKGAGNGDVNKGIQAMYDLMHRLERRAGGKV